MLRLLWAAQRANKHLVLALNIEGLPWLATAVSAVHRSVTGNFLSYDNTNSEFEYINAGRIEADQLNESMILYSHGGMLNPYVIGQLTHFAPIQRIAKDAMELGDKLDTCVIVQNLDVRDLDSGEPIRSRACP